MAGSERGRPVLRREQLGGLEKALPFTLRSGQGIDQKEERKK